MIAPSHPRSRYILTRWAGRLASLSAFAVGGGVAGNVLFPSGLELLGAVTLACLVFLLHVPIAVIRFHLYTSRIGWHSASPPTINPLLLIYRWRTDLGVGLLWFIRHTHSVILLLSISIMAFATVRAFRLENALEAARGAALIVAFALLSGMLGLLEVRILKLWWARLASDGSDKIRSLVDIAVDAATWRAQKYAALIAGFGTIAWAYGDQIAACWAFPLLQASDRSVACFRSTGPSDIQVVLDTLARMSEGIEEQRHKRDEHNGRLDEVSGHLQRVEEEQRDLLRQMKELSRRQGLRQSLNRIFYTSQNMVWAIQRSLTELIAGLHPNTAPAIVPPPSATASQFMVSFGMNQADLSDEAHKTIAEAVKRAVNARAVLCNGYSDASGVPATNVRLSVQRATSVALELIRKGVPVEKITIKGYGTQIEGRKVGIMIQ